MIGAEAARLSNQARFILEKCDGTVKVENKKKQVMIDELARRGYDSDPVKAWKKTQVRTHVFSDVPVVFWKFEFIC
jgi:DNA topoisomerase-2